MPLLLNQLQASSVRLFTPWKGVWFADVEVVLDETGIVPFGPCILTIGVVPMVGVIDPSASGSFAKSAKVRVLGGGGGWGKTVLPLPFANPAGVLSTAVYSATAAEVLEVVVDVVPSLLGSTTYLRSAGPASGVFASGVDWYVSPTGVTFVGPRLPLPYDPLSTEILSWDPLTRTAELSSDLPIAPGTILLDPLRFDGPLVVRDVEQTWGAAGARATCWCAGKSGSRLAGALSALVAASTALTYLKTYVYRVVLQDPASEALILQIVDPTTGVPNALPIDLWMGVPGIGAKVLLGSEVLVMFANGEPGRPCVVGFRHGDVPILLEIGTGLGGPLALAVGTQAQIAAIDVAIAAIATWIAAVTALAATPPTSTTFTLFGLAMAAPGATVAGVLGGLAAAVAAAVPSATSHLVVSD